MAKDPDIKAARLKALAALADMHEAQALKARTAAASDKVFAAAQQARFELEREAFEMELDTKRDAWETWLARDSKQRVYRFSDDVTSKSSATCIDTLTKWSRKTPGCDMKIIFTSPGGDVVAGIALFDFLMELRSKGHRITGEVRGYAASMAGILLQACDKRVIGKQSWVLIHEISAGMMGSWGELEDRMKWMERVQERILDVFTERSNGKKDRDQFEANWSRTDWWLSADDCIEWGVADAIG